MVPPAALRAIITIVCRSAESLDTWGMLPVGTLEKNRSLKIGSDIRYNRGESGDRLTDAAFLGGGSFFFDVWVCDGMVLYTYE